jgi:hypothetical protein
VHREPAAARRAGGASSATQFQTVGGGYNQSLERRKTPTSAPPGWASSVVGVYRGRAPHGNPAIQISAWSLKDDLVEGFTRAIATNPSRGLLHGALTGESKGGGLAKSYSGPSVGKVA